MDGWFLRVLGEVQEESKELLELRWHPLALVLWVGARAGNGCPAWVTRWSICTAFRSVFATRLSKAMVGGKPERGEGAANIINLLVSGNIKLNSQLCEGVGSGCFFLWVFFFYYLKNKRKDRKCFFLMCLSIWV